MLNVNLEGLRVFGKTAIYTNVFEDGKVQELAVPVYGLADVGVCSCAKYVRLAAKEMFDIDYPRADAWDWRYSTPIVAEVKQNLLEHFAEQGILKQGMAVGFHNPKSSYSWKTDIRGRLVKYTHIALYLGRNEKGIPLFAEQFVVSTGISSSDRMIRGKNKLTPIEILEARTQNGR